MAKLDIDVSVNGVNQVTTLDNKLKGLEKTSKSTTQSIAGLAKGLVALYGTMKSAQYLINTADNMTNLNNKLKLVTKSTQEYTTAQKELYKLAQTSRQEFSSTVDLYSRMARATDGLNLSQSKLLSVTDTINKALVVSGASAQEAQSAVVQLGQAMAGGVLRAEEFNSIIDASPRLIQVFADAIGGSIGDVRQLMLDGKLTTEFMLEALQNQAKVVTQEFSTMEATVSQAWTNLSNSIDTAIGDINDAISGSSGLAEGLQSVSRYIDDNREAIKEMAVQAGAYLGQIIDGFNAFGKSISFGFDTVIDGIRIGFNELIAFIYDKLADAMILANKISPKELFSTAEIQNVLTTYNQALDTSTQLQKGLKKGADEVTEAYRQWLVPIDERIAKYEQEQALEAKAVEAKKKEIEKAKKEASKNRTDNLKEVVKVAKEEAKKVENEFTKMAENIGDAFKKNFLDLIKGDINFGDFLSGTFTDVGTEMVMPVINKATDAMAKSVMDNFIADGTLIEDGGIFKGIGDLAGVLVDSAGKVISGGDILGAVSTGVGATTDLISNAVFSGFESVSSQLYSMGFKGASSAVFDFGAGFTQPFSISGGGLSAGLGQVLGGAGIGYGIGSLGDMLFGAETKAGLFGGIGGGIGGGLASLGLISNPVGWAIAIGSALLGGAFGKKKMTGTGIGFGATNELMGFEDWQKKSWFSKKSWTNWKELDDKTKEAIDQIGNSFQTVLDVFGDAGDKFEILKDEYAGNKWTFDTFFTEIMPTEFFKNLSDQISVDAIKADVLPRWKELAERLETTISDVLLQSFGGLEKVTSSMNILSRIVAGEDEASIRAELSGKSLSIFKSLIPKTAGWDRMITSPNGTEAQKSFADYYTKNPNTYSAIGFNKLNEIWGGAFKLSDSINVTIDNFEEYTQAVLKNNKATPELIDNLMNFGTALLELSQQTESAIQQIQQIQIQEGYVKATEVAYQNLENLFQQKTTFLGTEQTLQDIFVTGGGYKTQAGLYKALLEGKYGKDTGFDQTLKLAVIKALQATEGVQQARAVGNIQGTYYNNTPINYAQQHALQIKQLQVYEDLKKYIEDLRTDDKLSPFTLAEKLAISGEKFSSAVSAFLGGQDTSGEIKNYSKEYLDYSKRYLMDRSDYTHEFNKVTDTIDGISGGRNTDLGDIQVAIAQLMVGNDRGYNSIVSSVNNIQFKPISANVSLDASAFTTAVNALLKALDKPEAVATQVSYTPTTSSVSSEQAVYVKPTATASWDYGGASYLELRDLYMDTASAYNNDEMMTINALGGSTYANEMVRQAYEYGAGFAMEVQDWFGGYGFANGGIVNAPVRGIIGEAGYPEMITPLKDPNNPLQTKEMLSELIKMNERLGNLEQLAVKRTVDTSKLRKQGDRYENERAIA